jgi:uncharacterized HhH-GPD family protein
MARPALHLSGDKDADAFISKNPLGLVIGMLLDQQIRIEHAFWSPFELARRLGGTLDAATVAGYDPVEFAGLFSRPPALHRFPGSMAARVQALCQLLVADYQGDPTNVWQGVAEADELLRRVKQLPGFGDQKARIFVALLGKQLGVRPAGWEQVSLPYSEPDAHRSVADIVDDESLLQVRSFKRSMKAEHPGTKAPATTRRRKPRAKPPAAEGADAATG